MAQNDIQTRLMKIQAAVESAKAKKAEATGALKNLNKQLNESFNVGTVEEAEALLKRTEKEIAKLNAQIEERLVELEKLVRGKTE